MANAIAEEHPGLGKGLGRLQGKVAIVTGANSGIGRATARLFAHEGAKVVCCDIQETTSPRVDRLIEQDGGQAVYLQADVTRQADWDRTIDTTLERFHGLDILFNNAGGGVRKKIHEFTDDEWNFIMNLNLNSIFRGARAALPHFLNQGQGSIVNTASTFGILATEQYPAYCATKAAVVNLTRQMALDYLRVSRLYRDTSIQGLPATALAGSGNGGATGKDGQQQSCPKADGPSGGDCLRSALPRFRRVFLRHRPRPRD